MVRIPVNNNLNWSVFLSHLIATNYCATGDDITTIESLQLDYVIIQAATNNYSENNKIGEGGFGEVYKVLFLNFAWGSVLFLENLCQHIWITRWC